ncbi:hypothetical protein ACIRP0_22000 [Streptomyces sp. NPDC101733]|uniref:hypothetical protein n=1 Tax=unclassified Streptomyces TaxID=2593676 RepID=UPI003818E0E1
MATLHAAGVLERWRRGSGGGSARCVTTAWLPSPVATGLGTTYSKALVLPLTEQDR